ncbi:phage terminase small subunit P27 family [Limosilactobacillus mucosae]|uniref:Phage terminase small subunit P27 family n=1 Tax=Limosilactobacillus mucosae TaxID=97478 RepID=A0AAJ1HSQ5_LIMMU|nr:phage terminase small subunit P27 family [Limosilactobacillus mucosae]MDC2830056.1 phage terminase small subunit P27 family [Limosilactobacillus mucosae]MDC2837513.1 phage terminase small subunit P27 family [Limosilactobacillus mucosae]MDC2853780.1 phage terminase small subunit P27 family [Limosilactobacillus mucosae]
MRFLARKQKLLSQSTGHLRIVEQEAKYKAEFLAKDGFPELQKSPPAYLDKDAKAEYRRVVAAIGNLPLRDLDHAELENYCTWYSIYKQTTRTLSSVEDPDERERMVRTLDKATKNIKSLASDLGLNVNSRMQMNMPKTDNNKKESFREKYGIS